MTPEVIDGEYYLYLALWLLVPAVLFVAHGRGGRLTGILLYSYYVAFFMAHWVGALVHASPWQEFLESSNTITGFRLSTYGLLALALGALVVRSGPPRPRAQAGPMGRNPMDAFDDLAGVYLAAGAVFWVLALTPVADLPGAGAALGSGRLCAVYGICLFCWSAWRKGDWARFRLWISAAVVLPAITVLTQGFIGYGITMLAMIVVFVAMFYRPRWRLGAGFVLGIYAGMSLWVAYGTHRTAIREAVWGEQGFDSRLTALWTTLQSIEPFDFSNPAHLEKIDERLNQNFLVGAAMQTTPLFVPYAYGETLYLAVLAIIPRAVWPDKPQVGGSGDYVSRHTMIEFARGTSVGMGQVLEFYINFGVPCVLLGFFCLGAFLRWLDVRFVTALERGDVGRAQFNFLVGVGALHAGGSLTEIVASMGGGAVLSLALWRVVLGYRGSRSSRQPMPRKR